MSALGSEADLQSAIEIVRFVPSAEVVRDHAEQSLRAHRLELLASSQIGNPDVRLFITASLAIEIDLDRRKSKQDEKAAKILGKVSIAT